MEFIRSQCNFVDATMQLVVLGRSSNFYTSCGSLLHCLILTQLSLLMFSTLFISLPYKAKHLHMTTILSLVCKSNNTGEADSTVCGPCWCCSIDWLLYSIAMTTSFMLCAFGITLCSPRELGEAMTWMVWILLKVRTALSSVQHVCIQTRTFRRGRRHPLKMLGMHTINHLHALCWPDFTSGHTDSFLPLMQISTWRIRTDSMSSLTKLWVMDGVTSSEEWMRRVSSMYHPSYQKTIHFNFV